MHEYALVSSLVRRVEEEARRRGALAVRRVQVRVGELSGVDPDLFLAAYELFRAGTICEGAPLSLSRLAASWSCPRCARPVPRGEILRCPACAAPARLDDGGDALTLEAVEMEVP